MQSLQAFTVTRIPFNSPSFRRRLLRLASPVLSTPVAAVLARRYLRPSADFLAGFEHHVPKNAQRITKDGVTRIRFAASRDDRLEPPQRVLIAPGHDGQFRQFLRLARGLVDHGIEVDLLVLPGHTGTRLKLCSVGDIVEALRDCVDLAGPYDGLVTHCVSSNAALFASEAGPLAPKLVFLAAPIDLPALVRRGGLQYGLQDPCLARFVDAVSRLGRPWYLDRPWQATARKSSAELLVLHGRNDTAVPLEEAAAVTRVWPGARLAILPHGDHNSIVVQHEAIDRIAAFIAQKTASGRGDNDRRKPRAIWRRALQTLEAPEQT